VLCDLELHDLLELSKNSHMIVCEDRLGCLVMVNRHIICMMIQVQESKNNLDNLEVDIFEVTMKNVVASQEILLLRNMYI